VLKLFRIHFVILLFYQVQVYAYIDVDKASLGETRINHKENDFKVILNLSPDADVKTKVSTKLDQFSFEWVRIKEYLLAPRARLKVKLSHMAQDLYLTYKDKVINFQGRDEVSYTELFVSLYEKDPIQIYLKQKLIATLTVAPTKLEAPKILIDYTCSRNDIIVEGLTSEHFSMGCHTRRIGRFGKEMPMLEIMWISPELRVLDNEQLPYHATFLNKQPVQIKVQNIYTKEEKVITIKAKIPKRLHRMFTAYGLGPYAFNTETDDGSGNRLKNKVNVAPALFFYLNYKISETASVRGFDAAVFKDSNFNNAGMYLGNDFGFSFDNKLYFTTLIGMQYLYFKFDDDFDAVSEAIFPQGIEVMYRHAFGIPNYIISGGIFLSTTDAIKYENAWLRWGKNYFWELNLISWAKDDFSVKTWGVSIGFPFKGFL